MPIYPISGGDLEGARIEAEIFFPARIKQMLTKWRTGFPTIIDDRDVQIVQGETATGVVVTLCFDKETGLLTRLVRYSNSPVGRIVSRVDYMDYREVAGVKLPFNWTETWLDGRSNIELTSVEPNATIAATRFNMPAPSVPPAQ